jgi:hypothetical protein
VRHLYVLLLLLTTTALAYGQPNLAQILLAARSLKCHVGAGSGTTLADGKAKTASAPMNQDFYFDSINLTNHSARMIGTVGAHDVSVNASQAGLSFIEVAPLVVDLVTVFPVLDSNGEFVVFETRHANIYGTPLLEQYYGSCRVWQ